MSITTAPHFRYSTAGSDAPEMPADQQAAVERDLRIYSEMREIIQRARTALSFLPEPRGDYRHESPADLIDILADYLPDLEKARRVLETAARELV